jgi:MoxR-like ATPase
MKKSLAVKILSAGLAAALAGVPVSAQVIEAGAARAGLVGASAAAALPASAMVPNLTAVALPAASAPLAAPALSPVSALAAPAAAAEAPVSAPSAVPAAVSPAVRGTAASLRASGAQSAASRSRLAGAVGRWARSFRKDASKPAETASAQNDERFDGAVSAPALSAAMPVSAAEDAPQAGKPAFGAGAAFGRGTDPELAAKVKEKAAMIAKLRQEIGKVIVGQTEMVDSIIISMIAGEHVFLEGMPGVAKTKTINTAADAVQGKFKRVQGTPDKLPSDIIGTEVLEDDAEHPGMKVLSVKFGPVFTNILLVDEINRMPPKTQAALLEAMAEGQVTIGDKTYKLSKPFIVLATQNPIEQEGTYRLPEAQQDRFMFKVIVNRPSLEETKEIMRRFAGKDGQPKSDQVSNLEELAEVNKLAEQVRVDPAIEDYIANIIEATHDPVRYGVDIPKGAIEANGGASPRAAIYLMKSARIHALIEGRAWVSPSDVEAVAHRVLRHRLILGFSAPRDLTTDAVVAAILNRVPLPRPSAGQ